MQILNFNGNVNGDYYYLAAFKKIYKNVTEQIVILLLSAAVIIHTVLCLQIIPKKNLFWILKLFLRFSLSISDLHLSKIRKKPVYFWRENSYSYYANFSGKPTFSIFSVKYSSV